VVKKAGFDGSWPRRLVSIPAKKTWASAQESRRGKRTSDEGMAKTTTKESAATTPNQEVLPRTMEVTKGRGSDAIQAGWIKPSNCATFNCCGNGSPPVQIGTLVYHQLLPNQNGRYRSHRGEAKIGPEGLPSLMCCGVPDRGKALQIRT